jgi:selenocysteine-specific elongation factor
MITIGGGEIRKPAALEVIEESGLETVELRQLVSRLGNTPERIREEIAALSKSGAIHVLSENPLTVVSMRDFDEVSGRTVTEIREFHRTNPLVQGMGREELRARIFAQAPNLLFQAVLDRLIAAKKIATAHDIVYEFDRKVTLKTGEERIREQLRERFRSLGLQAPAPGEVIDALKLNRSTAQKIIQLMVKENTLVKVSENMLVDRGALDKRIADVKAVRSKNSRLGVGEFKDLTGVSRKYAIPLLEYLDRQRVTRRVGDERMIL